MQQSTQWGEAGGGGRDRDGIDGWRGDAPRDVDDSGIEKPETTAADARGGCDSFECQA